MKMGEARDLLASQFYIYRREKTEFWRSKVTLPPSTPDTEFYSLEKGRCLLESLSSTSCVIVWIALHLTKAQVPHFLK